MLQDVDVLIQVRFVSELERQRLETYRSPNGPSRT